MTVNVMGTPATALPLASRTMTEGTSATGVPTIPVSCVGEAGASVVLLALGLATGSRHETTARTMQPR